MSTDVSAERIRAWIDDDLVEAVDAYPDPAAEINLTVEMSNLVIHVIRRDPDGPILVGQEIEYDDEIRERIQSMEGGDRDEMVARIRETMTEVPVIYGFRNPQGENVVFREMSNIFIESRIYPDELSQDALMTRLVDVWKAMRYLDDIVTLMNAVER
ncbi:MAG: DUF2299 family protein [Haloferacaceae archaeon]